MVDTCLKGVIISVVSVLVLLLVILLPLSFSGVEYYEYGFKRQKSTGKVNTDEVYGGGKHMVGPDYEFKTFSSVAHFVDFEPLSVYTYHKHTIDLNVYFQYFLRKEDLSILHKKFDLNYNSLIKKNAIAAIKSETPKFTRHQFITDRPKVEAALYKAVSERLGGLCCSRNCKSWSNACPENCIPVTRCNSEKDKGLWVDVKFFQLGLIEIDKDVQENYLRTLTLGIDTERKKLEQKASVIRKTTTTKVLAIKNAAKEIRQTAQAQSELVHTVSQANYTVTVEKARTEGLKSLYARLNIKDEKIKNSFDYLRTLRGIDNVHFTVDFQQRIVGKL